MRQLTCVGPGKIEWQDVPEPRIGGDLEALVRPLTVARCDIDRLLIDGTVPQRGPFALGHEAVVEIVALGDQVRGLALGQRAVVSFQLSCGECRACKLGHTANCDRYPSLSDYGMQPLSGVEYGGMLSDLVRVPHASAMLQPISPRTDALALASVSDNVLDGYRAVAPHLRERPASDVLIVHHGGSSIALYAAQAALALASASDNVLDGYRAVAPHLRERPASDVLIVHHGGSSIALYAAQAALALGATRVDFASDDAETLALAERLGAHALQTDFGRRLRRYPIVVDYGIRPEGLDFALRCTEPEGICQSVSLYLAPIPLPLVRMYTHGVRFCIGRCNAAALLREVVPLIESGRLQPGNVTTKIVEWEDAADAFAEPAIKLVVRRSA